MEPCTDDIRFWQALLANDLPENRPQVLPERYRSQESWSGSNFWRWQAASGKRILKVWPDDGPDERTHGIRHRWLRDLTGFRPKLALPLPDRTGRTIRHWPGGRIGELFEWIEGVPFTAESPVTILTPVIGTLSQVHEAFRKQHGCVTGVSKAVRTRLADLSNFDRHISDQADRTFEEISEFLAPEDREILGDLIRISKVLHKRALRRLAPFATELFALQVVLRDARPQHFLTIDSAIQGLIDFGAIGIDAIEVDIARIAAELKPGDRQGMHAVVSLYRESTGGAKINLGLVESLELSGAVLGGTAWVDIVRRNIFSQRTGAIDPVPEFTRALVHARSRSAAWLPTAW